MKPVSAPQQTPERSAPQQTPERFGVFIENACRQRTMLGASRAHADELSFDQLVFPVVIRKIEHNAPL